ncbi:S-adenosyl-L-methionine-dependent methyltransferase [Scenedesmus sp. NREL 46B-D3]|nr:S-adenosyl-L-methionine-dependent methyltransferase [Scenedesmus sp. NREL 46B-D3]
MFLHTHRTGVCQHAAAAASQQQPWLSRTCLQHSLHHSRSAARRRVCVAVATAECLPLHCLPSGLNVRHTSTPAEVQFLYDEQYSDRCYLQHGVSLAPGATVVDVGANIGIFSMFAAEAAGPTGFVLSVEPAPLTAAALASNLQQHSSWCSSQGRQLARHEVVQAAVGDGSTAEAMLTVYPGAAGWATLQRDDAEVLDNMQAYLHNLLTAPPAAAAAVGTSAAQAWSPAQRMLVSFARWVGSAGALRPLSRLMGRLYVQLVMLRQAAAVPCRLLTVSQLIEQHALGRVDMLKIDVERAELQVLQGVQQHHWPRIQQVAMEVHDVDGQLATVVRLLRDTAGFTRVVANQDDMLRGSKLYNVFAVRS